MSSQFQTFIDDVAMAARLLDIAEQCGLQVERRHGKPVALCPFHDDHRPSLQIYERGGSTDRDQFHCFACGAHGDVFTLVSKLRNLDFWQAATWVAGQCGISPPQSRRGQRPSPTPKLRGLEDAVAIYKNQSEAELFEQRELLSDRNFLPASLSQSEVYFARGNKISSSLRLDKDRDRIEALQVAGVIRYRQPKYLPKESAHLGLNIPPRDLFFDDRLVFVIRGLDNAVVGLAGRAIKDGKPKYLFTEGFARRETLYGINRAFEAVRRTNPKRGRGGASKTDKLHVVHLFLVEGLFDVLRMESLGFLAAGVLGSQLTAEQAALIEKLAREADRNDAQLAVHLFLDNDNAGQSGMATAIPRLMRIAAEGTSFGLDVVVPNLASTSPGTPSITSPLPHDPDELFRDTKGKREAMQSLKSWNYSVIEFMVSAGTGVPIENLDTTWGSLDAGVRQRACRYIERQLSTDLWATTLARLLPFDRWLANSTTQSSEWKADVSHFLSTPIVSKTATSSSRVARTFTRDLSDEASLLHALQLAEASTQRREVPVDNGSWIRLKLAWDVASSSLIDQLADTRRQPEPLLAIHVPRLDGRYRLKALPCPEDLTIQQYVLNELLCGRDTPAFLNAIPAVRYFGSIGNGIIRTTGPEDLLPADGKTVSFAYQIDMDVLESNLPPRKEGMFRPYYRCWCDFISFIDRGVIESSLTTFHVARLDVRRFYDMLPRHAVHDALFPGVRNALSILSQEGGALMQSCAKLLGGNPESASSESPDHRARIIVDWLCDQSFGYRFLHPANGFVDSTQPLERGVPQGPDLSAYLANISLFRLDHVLSFAAKQSGAIYARYVDDMVLVAPSASILSQLRSVIEDQLSKLGLELSSKTDRLPAMSSGDLRMWLTDSRGGLGVSGPFAGPPVNEPLSSLQPLADAGEVDRADALTLLHDTDLIDPASERDVAMQTIRIARASPNLRFGDHVKAAQALWAISDYSNIPAENDIVKVVAKQFYEDWKETSDPRLANQIDLNETERAHYLNMVTLYSWLDGLDAFMRRRHDCQPDLSEQSKGILRDRQRALAELVNSGLCYELERTIFGVEGVQALKEHAHVIEIKKLLLLYSSGELPGAELPSIKRGLLRRPTSHAQYRILLSIAEQRGDSGLIEYLAGKSPDEYWTSTGDWMELRSCFHEAIVRLRIPRESSGSSFMLTPDPLQSMVGQYNDLYGRLGSETKESYLANVLTFWMPDTGSTHDEVRRDLDLKQLAIVAAVSLIRLSAGQADFLSKRRYLAQVVLNVEGGGDDLTYFPEPSGIGVPGILGIAVTAASVSSRIERIVLSEPATCVPALDWDKVPDGNFTRYRADLSPFELLMPVGTADDKRPSRKQFDNVNQIPRWLADAFENIVQFSQGEVTSSSEADADHSSMVVPPTATNLLSLRDDTATIPVPVAILAHAVETKRIGPQAFRRFGTSDLVAEPINASHADLWRVGTALADFLGYLDSKIESVLFQSNDRSEPDVTEHWTITTLLRLAFRRLRGFSIPAKELPIDETSELRLPRTVSRMLRCLREFPVSGTSSHQIRLVYLLKCLAENRAFETRFDDRLRISFRSERGAATAQMAEIASRLYRADEGLAEELPALSVTATWDPGRRPVLAWHRLAERLALLQGEAILMPTSGVENLNPAIACCHLMSATIQLRMQSLELWSGLTPEQRGSFQSAELDLASWNLDECSLLHLSQGTRVNGSQSVTVEPRPSEHAANTSLVFRELLRISDDSTANEWAALDRITPLGWCVVLGALAGFLRTQSQGPVCQLYGLDDPRETEEVSTNFRLLAECLATEQNDSTDLPWGDLEKAIEVWRDTAALSRHYELFDSLDKLCGLKVKTLCSQHLTIGDGRGKTRTIVTSSETRILKSWQIISASAQRERRNHGVERTVIADDSALHSFRWSETWMGDSLVSIGTVAMGIARLAGLIHPVPDQVDSNPQSATNEKAESTSENAFSNETSVLANTDSTSKSSNAEPESKENNESGESRDSATAKHPDLTKNLEWLKRAQETSWKSRNKLGCHIRIAFFQFDVDDTYRHPLFDVCLQHPDPTIGNGRLLDDALAKDNHHKWNDEQAHLQYESTTVGLPSCAEHRRRILLEKVLQACNSLKVDVLLLPEYAVRPETVAWLQKEVNTLSPNTYVWAGTFRHPPGMKMSSGRGLFDRANHVDNSLDVRAWSAVLSLVIPGQEGVKWRKKKYPAMALNEQFSPLSGTIDPLVTSDAAGLHSKIMELVCSEVFIATSPSNLFSEAFAYRKLLQQFGIPPVGNLEATAKDVVVGDIMNFAQLTSMCHDHRIRRSIVLVPAMSTRAVDYAVLGQAGYLAAGLTTVFCNAARQNGRGHSCFIGHDGWDKEEKGGVGLPSGQRYHGQLPGIYKPFNEGRGWLGESEQAVVVADIDPFYSTEGKPRPQMLPPPLELVAHLPVVEVWRDDKKKVVSPFSCRCGRAVENTRLPTLGEVNHVISQLRQAVENKRYSATSDDIAPRELFNALKVLAKAAGHSASSDWLVKRANAYLSHHRADPTEWPPPVCFDWLLVDSTDMTRISRTRIEVPAFSLAPGENASDARNPE